MNKIKNKLKTFSKKGKKIKIKKIRDIFSDEKLSYTKTLLEKVKESRISVPPKWTLFEAKEVNFSLEKQIDDNRKRVVITNKHGLYQDKITNIFTNCGLEYEDNEKNLELIDEDYKTLTEVNEFGVYASLKLALKQNENDILPYRKNELYNFEGVFDLNGFLDFLMLSKKERQLSGKNNYIKKANNWLFFNCGCGVPECAGFYEQEAYLNSDRTVLTLKITHEKNAFTDNEIEELNKKPMEDKISYNEEYRGLKHFKITIKMEVVKNALLKFFGNITEEFKQELEILFGKDFINQLEKKEKVGFNLDLDKNEKTDIRSLNENKRFSASIRNLIKNLQTNLGNIKTKQKTWLKNKTSFLFINEKELSLFYKKTRLSSKKFGQYHSFYKINFAPSNYEKHYWLLYKTVRDIIYLDLLNKEMFKEDFYFKTEQEKYNLKLNLNFLTTDQSLISHCFDYDFTSNNDYINHNQNKIKNNQALGFKLGLDFINLKEKCQDNLVNATIESLSCIYPIYNNLLFILNK